MSFSTEVQRPDATWPIVSGFTEHPEGFECLLGFPEDYSYFEGHFPGMPLVPAVAQFDLVLRLLARTRGCAFGTVKLNRLKFSGPIYPGSQVRLVVSYSPEQRQVSFQLGTPDGQTAYSSGKASLNLAGTPGAAL